MYLMSFHNFYCYPNYSILASILIHGSLGSLHPIKYLHFETHLCHQQRQLFLFSLRNDNKIKYSMILAYFMGLLKVPSPIASDFFQTLRDFGIRRKLIFFSLPQVNFTAEKCTVWKILMKM